MLGDPKRQLVRLISFPLTTSLVNEMRYPAQRQISHDLPLGIKASLGQRLISKMV